MQLALLPRLHLSAEAIEYIYVNILIQNDKYAIVTSQSYFEPEDGTAALRVNDIYIVEHERVKEGQVFHR